MLDPEIRRLITVAGFNQAYEELLPESYSYRHCYEQTEAIYEKYFLCRRYSSFESFYQVRQGYLKKRKKQVIKD